MLQGGAEHERAEARGQAGGRGRQGDEGGEGGGMGHVIEIPQLPDVKVMHPAVLATRLPEVWEEVDRLSYWMLNLFASLGL